MTALAQANRAMAGALLVLALTGAAGMFWVDGRLSRFLAHAHPSEEEEQRRLQHQIAADERVEHVLSGLAVDADTDRALVYLAHNGQTDLTRSIPFLFLSATHVHMRPGLAWQERWSRPVSLSVFSGLLRRMFREPTAPVCVKRDRGDADMSEVARARMIDRGVELAFACPLRGRSGVVGIVVAEYLRRDTPRPPDAEVTAMLTRATSQVLSALVAAP